MKRSVRSSVPFPKILSLVPQNPAERTFSRPLLKAPMHR
jgi:hypothetical protein